MSLKWDQRFLRLALEIASWSKDESTKVGSVVVGPKREIRSTGYNGIPRGVDDDVAARHERPLKYSFFEHSERNCCYDAARRGVSLEGCTIYIASFPAKFGPCDNCCRAIIQSGIVRVVIEPPAGDLERWKESFQVGETMLLEAGVRINHVVL